MRSFFPAYLFFRVVAIVLYLGGMALLVFPAGELFKAKAMNWQDEFVRVEKRWKNSLKTLTALTDENYTSGDDLQKRYNIELSQFVEERIKGHVIDVSGSEWEGFFTDLALFQQNRQQDSSWADARGWFKADFKPLAGIRNNFADDKTFFYVQINGENERKEHIFISLCPARELARVAPAHLAFPYRNAGFWMILSGILVYLFNSSSPENYKRVRLNQSKTSRGPDFFAAIFSPIFVIIGGMAGIEIGLKPLSGEWLIVSSIFWLFSLLFASTWLVTAWYKAFSIEYSEHNVVFNDLFGSADFEMNRIKEARMTMCKNPWWMKLLLFIGRISARVKATREIYQDKDEPGFELAMGDGTTSPGIRFSNLNGLGDFFAELESHGVYVEESLKQKAAVVDTEYATGPWLITRIISKALSLLMIAAASYGIVNTFSIAEPIVKSPGFPEGSAFESVAENSQPTTEELAERVRKNNELMQEVNRLSQQINDISERAAKTTDPELRKQLSEESEVIMQKIMQLREKK